MVAALVVLGGYLLGSMPFGYWLPLLLRHDDIRTHGSGNIGGSNVWRVYGRAYGIPVVLLDVAKGFVPALLATLFVGHLAGVLAGGAAMLGHWRPLFLRFARGGKVVATCGSSGWRRSWAASAPRSGSSCSPSSATRRSRRSRRRTRCRPSPRRSATPWPVDVFAGAAALAVLVLHRTNISRLRSGTESRFRFRRRPAQPVKS